MDRIDLEFYEHFSDKMDTIIDLLHQALDKIDAMMEDEISCDALYVEDECLFCEASVEE